MDNFWTGFFDEMMKISMSLKPVIPKPMKMSSVPGQQLSPSKILDTSPGTNKVSDSITKKPEFAVGANIAPPPVS